MKTFLVLCVVLVTGIHGEFVSPFPKQYDQIVDACRAETGYTDEVVAKEEESYFSENKGLRIFNYCFLEKTGFVTSDGELNIDDALDKFTPGPLKATIEDCERLERRYAKSVFSTCFHAHVSNNMRMSKINNIIQSKYDNFTQIVEVCRKETGYTDEVIAEEEKSNLDKDTGLKKFNNCFLEKTGFGDEEKFDIDDAIAKIPQSNVTEILEICQLKIAKKIIPDSVPFFSACIHQGVSAYIRKDHLELVVHDETDHVNTIVHDCQEKTGFTEAETEATLHGEDFKIFSVAVVVNDEELKKFNDCFLEKTGFITSDGKLNIDAALVRLVPGFAKPIVEHCQANIILNYLAEDVDDFSTCYHDGIQNHIADAERVEYPAFEGAWKLFVPGTSFVDTIFTPGPISTYSRSMCFSISRIRCPFENIPLSH